MTSARWKVVLGAVASLVALGLFGLAVRELLASGAAFCTTGQGACGVAPWWTQVDRMAWVLVTGLLAAGLIAVTVRAAARLTGPSGAPTA